MIDCSWKKHFGIDCLTCGFQRSFLELCQGHFIESLKLYPATIPLLLLFTFLLLHLFFKFKNGARVILYTFSFNVFIILMNFTYKLII